MICNYVKVLTKKVRPEDLVSPDYVGSYFSVVLLFIGYHFIVADRTIQKDAPKSIITYVTSEIKKLCNIRMLKDRGLYQEVF